MSTALVIPDTMGSLTIKVPDDMERDIDQILEDHPHYLNKSEFVRDAVRHLIDEHDLKLSDKILEADQQARNDIENGRVTPIDELE